MQIRHLTWDARSGWSGVEGESDASLVMFFGARAALSCGARYHELRAMFPNAHVLGCSTGGQINNNDINDDAIVAAAIGFEATPLKLCREEIGSVEQSRAWSRSSSSSPAVGWLQLPRQPLSKRYRFRCRRLLWGRSPSRQSFAR